MSKGIYQRKPFTEEHRRNMSKNNVKYWKGKEFSKEHKKKLSEAHKGYRKPESVKRKISENHARFWFSKKRSEEVRKILKENRYKQVFPIKDTSIEIKIQNFLKQLGIEFFTHQYIHIEHDYQCDIFIPSKNLIIECDGDYWHKYPTGTDIDNIRTKELLEKGFKVIRLWEHEINSMKLNDLKEIL